MVGEGGGSMRIAVVGAGPGGLAAACGLVRAGHDVHVYERAPGLRLGGSAVTLWPNGTAVLQDLGVPVDGLGPTIEVLDGRSDQGRPLLRMPTAALSARFGAPVLSVPRGRLVERLASAPPAGAVTVERACAGVDPVSGELAFDDGTTAVADVVVGADGRESAVRRAVRPEARARPTGWVTWQGLSAVPVELTGSARILTLLGPAGFCGLQPAGEGLLQWYFSIPPGPDGRPPTVGDGSPVEMLRRRFAGWADPVPRVLEALDDAETTPWPHHSLRVPVPWGAGRATLLGDAAHAMPPSLAQGVNQTLEDAHALTTALGRVDAQGAVVALRGYERSRARQVARIAAMAASESSTTHRRSTTLLMRAMPQRLAVATYAGLLRRSSSVLAHRSRTR